MLPIFTLAAPPRAQCLTALRRKVLRSQELPAARSCPPPGRNATPSLALRPPPRGVEKCFDGTVAKKRKPRAVPLLRLSAVPLPGAVPLLRKARAHDFTHTLPRCLYTQCLGVSTRSTAHATRCKRAPLLATLHIYSAAVAVPCPVYHARTHRKTQKDTRC